MFLHTNTRLTSKQPLPVALSVLIRTLMIFFFRLTFDNCTGPSAWLHRISNERPPIMGRLKLIFSIPFVVPADILTPRRLFWGLHSVLKYLHYCLKRTGTLIIMISTIYWIILLKWNPMNNKSNIDRLTFWLYLHNDYKWFWKTTDL